MRWDLLRSVVPLPMGHTINFAHLLQHISTIGGMVTLAVWFVSWYHRTPPVPSSTDEFSPWLKIALLLVMAVIAGLMAYPIALLRLMSHALPTKPLHLMVTIFEAATLVFCLELLTYSLALTASTRLQRASASQTRRNRIRLRSTRKRQPSRSPTAANISSSDPRYPSE